MFARILSLKNGAIGPIFILIIPFWTLIPISNPIISLILLLMISLLPGMAILELFRFSFNSITTRYFYAVLFSILLVMALFTIYSVIVHSIGISAPLSPIPVKIICLLVTLPSMTFLMRRLAVSRQSSLKSFQWSIFTPRFLSLCLPVIALICVLRLNAFSDGTSTAIFLILLTLLFLILTVNPRITPDTNLQAWLIFGTCAALVLGTTFRGDGGFWGFDINSEFFSASNVLTKGSWVPPQGSSAYDSMLSITVLPVVISLFSKLSLTVVFKIFYALILAFIPTVLYVWCVQYVSRFSAMILSGSLIIGSISYIPQMTALNRQAIGMAFFVGILLVISEQSWTVYRKQSVGLLMASGMAVSHYSTAYLASAFFAISLVISLFLFLVSRRRWIKVRGVFTPAFCISLILITVVWNGVVNNSLQDIKRVIDITSSQGLNLLPNQNQSLWSRWVSGAVGNAEPSATAVTTMESLRAGNLDYGKIIRITPAQEALSYQLQPASIPDVRPILGTRVGATYEKLVIFGRSFFQLFAAVGLFFLIRRFLARDNRLRSEQLIPSTSQALDLFGIGVGAVAIGLIARVSGTLGGFYNPERAALQIVIVVLIPTVIAIEYLLFRQKVIQIFLAVPVLFFLVVLLIQATSLGGYVTGSDITRISSLQSNYSPFVISEGERNASSWLAGKLLSNSYIQTDSRGSLALLQNGRRGNSTSLDPVNLAIKTYIYATNSNIVGKVARAQTFFVFPDDYIRKHYQVIYSTNQARIYH
jgi:uncharacterized membrane protein